MPSADACCTNAQKLCGLLGILFHNDGVGVLIIQCTVLPPIFFFEESRQGTVSWEKIWKLTLVEVARDKLLLEEPHRHVARVRMAKVL